MNLYAYDKDTKEYLGELEANIDPLESAIQERDVFVIPPYCTTIPPKFSKERKVNVFNEEKGTWELIDNNRGLIVYDKSTKEPIKIVKLGPIPEGFVKEKPFDLQEYKETIRSLFNISYSKAQEKKVKIGKLFVNLDDRLILIRALENITEEYPLYYFDTDTESVPLNKSDVELILAGLYKRSMNLPEKRNDFLTRIRKSRSKKDLDNIKKEIAEFE